MENCVRTILRIGKYFLFSTVALLLLAIGSLISLRSCSQRSNAKSFAILTPKGISEAGFVKIGGIEQWVQIRGQNRENPVLLCVHGGPGGTWIPVTRLFIPWEKDFTVVQWDQRGAGKTLGSTGASIAETMSVDRMAQDGIEVAEYLRTHLHKDKVILLGHSWGSILGVYMVKRRPDLFYAFVGTGQASDLPRSMEMDYSLLLEQSKAANDQRTHQALMQIGPPPFDNPQKIRIFFRSIDKYQPPSDQVAMEAMKQSLTSPAPNYSLLDEINKFRGFISIPTLRLYNEMLSTQLSSLGPDFEIPIFIFHGTDDPVTPVSLAVGFFKSINAPKKELVLLKGGGHFAVFSMGDRFLKEMTTRVRPTTIDNCEPPTHIPK